MRRIYRDLLRIELPPATDAAMQQRLASFGTNKHGRHRVDRAAFDIDRAIAARPVFRRYADRFPPPALPPLGV